MAAPVGNVVVLDRDGVINEDSGDFIKSVAEWHPIRGSLQAIARLSSAGFRVAVITNQSGVARGLLTEATLREIHRHMSAAVELAGGRLAGGIYYCPHHPDDGCDCRKPRSGLLHRLAADLGCSLTGAPFIGDRLSDLLAAEAVGARPILVRTGSGATTERALRGRAIEVFADLEGAAEALLAEAARR